MNYWTDSLKYFSQHWQYSCLLLGFMLNCGSMISLSLGLVIGERKKEWKERVKASIPPESISNPMERPITPTMKTSTAIRIILPLVIIFTSAGYAVGIHLQSKQDAKVIAEKYSKYESDRTAWIERNKQWTKDYETWKSKHAKQEKVNVRRSVSSPATTGTATYTATTEPGPVRRW